MTLLPSSDAYFLRHPVPLVAQAHARAKERRARLEAMVVRAKRQAAVLELAKPVAEAIATTAPAPSAPAPFVPGRKLSGLALIRQIQSVVAARHGVTVADIMSRCRRQNIVRPRQIAAYLARAMTGSGLPEIGRRLGGFDHTTILYSVRNIEQMKATDPDFAREVDALVIAIGGDG